MPTAFGFGTTWNGVQCRQCTKLASFLKMPIHCTLAHSSPCGKIMVCFASDCCGTFRFSIFLPRKPLALERNDAKQWDDRCVSFFPERWHLHWLQVGKSGLVWAIPTSLVPINLLDEFERFPYVCRQSLWSCMMPESSYLQQLKRSTILPIHEPLLCRWTSGCIARPGAHAMFGYNILYWVPTNCSGKIWLLCIKQYSKMAN